MSYQFMTWWQENGNWLWLTVSPTSELSHLLPSTTLAARLLYPR
jgi:hypothetical protein